MLRGELPEQLMGVGGVQEHLVVGPAPVERAEQPQILVTLLRRREVEQPEPVVDGERVDPEAVLRQSLVHHLRLAHQSPSHPTRYALYKDAVTGRPAGPYPR